MEIQLWREILEPYELAVRELSLKFDHLMTEYGSTGAIVRSCGWMGG